MSTQLNLARKWRPQTFESVVGQDIAVRMLKNSLFTGKFFPVYLFAGQRGCGKTTSARIFAAALNCANLEKFQQTPSIKVPCLECSSCKAMSDGSHPDYIEIDAASHTGVDHVRQLIESSSYMPLLGKKKIYLIDEAHMLSKAAFNALLKLLEEPPMSVHFMLATTEIPKLPQTILSRCFQLSFGALNSSALKEHLRYLCTQENVTIDDAAIDIIFDESEGSARDAINLLERVRFSTESVTADSVLAVLGKVRTSDVIELIKHCVSNDSQSLLTEILKLEQQQYSPTSLWDSLIVIIRQLTLIKFGGIKADGQLAAYDQQLHQIAQLCSGNRLHAMMQLLWSQEQLFMMTSKKSFFLQTVLMQLCNQVNIADIQELISLKSIPSQAAHKNERALTPPHATTRQTPQLAQTHATPIAAAQGSMPLTPLPVGHQSPEVDLSPPTISDNPWQRFQTEISGLQDQLLVSILKQASFGSFDGESGKLSIKVQKNIFFLSKLEETKNIWHPCLAKHFEGLLTVNFEDGESAAPQTPRQQVNVVRPALMPTTQRTGSSSGVQKKTYDTFVINNPDEWPMTSMVMSYFPGKLKKL